MTTHVLHFMLEFQTDVIRDDDIHSALMKKMLSVYHHVVLERTDVVSPSVIFMRRRVNVVPRIAPNLDTIIRAWHLKKHWRAICGAGGRKSGLKDQIKSLIQITCCPRLTNSFTCDLDINRDTKWSITHCFVSN